MNSYQIVFDPQLNIDTNEFITHWNQNPEAGTVAKAETLEKPVRNIDWMPTVIAALSGVAVGVATNAIYDLIKKIANPLVQGNHAGEILEIKEITQADGSKMVIVVMRNQ